MCMVSMVGDSFREYYEGKWPNPGQTITFEKPISRLEFDELRKEILAIKELLIAAKKYDEATRQKDCHMDEKVALLKRLAEIVDVEFEDIF